LTSPVRFKVFFDGSLEILSLYLLCGQILDSDAIAVFDDFCDPLPVTLPMVALVA
jgi:hypothetical protein